MSDTLDIEVQELGPDGVREMLNTMAQHYFEISGDEFQRRWEAGEYEDDDRPGVMRIALLLPEPA